MFTSPRWIAIFCIATIFTVQISEIFGNVIKPTKTEKELFNDRKAAIEQIRKFCKSSKNSFLQEVGIRNIKTADVGIETVDLKKAFGNAILKEYSIQQVDNGFKEILRKIPKKTENFTLQAFSKALKERKEEDVEFIANKNKKSEKGKNVDETQSEDNNEQKNGVQLPDDITEMIHQAILKGGEIISKYSENGELNIICETKK